MFVNCLVAVNLNSGHDWLWGGLDDTIVNIIPRAFPVRIPIASLKFCL